MVQRHKIYEGKAKILYEGPKPGTLVQHFKDDITAFDSSKRTVMEGKGVLNNRISEFLMKRLGEVGVPTHFLKRLNMREQLVKALEIIPLEVICRNFAAGSLSERLGLSEGEALPRPVIEFCYKKDGLGDPLVGEELISAFGWASNQELDDMVSLTFRVNDFLFGLFAGAGIRLVDFKLEYGRLFEGGELVQTVLADEISPDGCRLWDMETNRKLDKDRFRRDLGGVTDAYAEVARRIGVIRDVSSLSAAGD